MSNRKYYTLSYSLDRDLVGTIPQINRIKDVDRNDVDFYHNLSDITEFPTAIPKLSNLILDEDAQYTDFINITIPLDNNSF